MKTGRATGGLFAAARFALALWGLGLLLRIQARRYPAFREQLRQKDLAAQIRLRDGSRGRYFVHGIQLNPDVTMSFRDPAVATRILRPKRDRLEFLNAAKNSQLELHGPGHLVTHFSNALTGLFSAGAAFGVRRPGGVIRYTNNTNGGPVFVDVKDGKILRITPLVFDDSDPPPWTIHARGRSFTPPEKTTVSPHALCWKSLVYSPDRILYPLKRVDSYESSATYEPLGVPGDSDDRGGCVNILTPSRMMIARSHALAANSCLIQVEKWNALTPR